MQQKDQKSQNEMETPADNPLDTIAGMEKKKFLYSDKSLRNIREAMRQLELQRTADDNEGKIGNVQGK